MRVLVAGASGVIGRQLVPLLASVGHVPVALARSGVAADRLRAQGVVHVAVGDALDVSALQRATEESSPDAIVSLLTAIPRRINPRRMTRDFAMTNRLRTEGTGNLLTAAKAVDARHVVMQGLAYAYDPADGLANEDAPLWHHPPKQFAPVLRALKTMEELTAAANGVVLRVGHLYGPGSHYADDGSFVSDVRRGKVPLVGGGTSTFSFTHAHDAASAVVAALDKEATGVLNIVDDDPAQMRLWLPLLAQIVGGPRPRSAPVTIARLTAGAWGAAYMTQLRGADNARARLTLDWRPRYSSWRQGFAELSRAA